MHSSIQNESSNWPDPARPYILGLLANSGINWNIFCEKVKAHLLVVQVEFCVHIINCMLPGSDSIQSNQEIRKVPRVVSWRHVAGHVVTGHVWC